MLLLVHMLLVHTLLDAQIILVIPLLAFLVLLTNKLDGSIRVSYFAASAPLFLTFFTLVITSFGSKGGKSLGEI